MDVLWAPWRSQYIQTFKDEDKKDQESCFFCEALEYGNDREMLIVARREHCFVIMNRYPYNGGHVLIAPYKHVGELSELDDEVLLCLMKTSKDTLKVLEHISNPHGYNLGANLGRSAGAGVPGHLHFHIVPRWDGDTSFMTIFSDVKVVSQALDETWKAVHDGFNELFPND
jgi:ATP adenylyltransferase